MDDVSTVLRELFRYRKGRRTRAYSMSVASDTSAELWVVTEEGGRATGSRKLVTFKDGDDVAPFLHEVERELRKGGWCAV
jgi:hypothetical protein